MNIDDKLRDIFEQHRMNVQEWDKETLDLECIKLIKQAFADEGYMQEPRTFDVYGNLKINGQEWYERYQTALKGKVFAFDEGGNAKIVAAVTACDEAAKKASGL